MSVRYLGELTRCKSLHIRDLHQARWRVNRGFGAMRRCTRNAPQRSCFTLQIRRRIILVSADAMRIARSKTERTSHEPSQSSLRFRGHAAGPAHLGGMRKPDLGRGRGRAHARHRRARHGDHGCDHRAHRRPAGFCRLRPRALSASETGRARHPDRRPSRYRPSRRHAGEAAVAARRQQMLRPRHLRHEGRQLPLAGSDPATGARVLHDAAADHRAVHAGRGSRHALDPRHHRGGGRAQQIRAGAGARPRQQRRRHRPLRDRALQPRSHRQAEPCRRHALLRPLGDPRDGAPDHRDRRHDHGGLHLLASASCMAANGSIASPPPAPARR